MVKSNVIVQNGHECQQNGHPTAEQLKANMKRPLNAILNNSSAAAANDVLKEDPKSNRTSNSISSSIGKRDYENGVASKKPRLMKKPTHVANGHSNGVANGTSNGTANGVSQLNGAHVAGKPTEKFMDRMYNLLMSEVVENARDPNLKVVNFQHPKELEAKLDLEIRDKPESDDTLMKHCQQTINYSVRTGHPRFMNQLFGGFDQYTLAGSWLTEAVNASQYTYEVAPVFTLMEQSVLKKMRGLVGYPDGDGIFCPGGSISNMYGTNLARYHFFPDFKNKGMYSSKPLVMFTSAQCHYSIQKAAAFLGLGVDNCKSVPCDTAGRMITSELVRMIDESIEQGCAPFMVVATGGTTVLGSFDPVDEVADVCEKYKLWLHVDCCWGGGVLLSEKHKGLLKGIERSDSCAWNPHKMMGTPQQCAAFMTRHTGLLQAAHSANARYLFQQDKFYDVSYDTGDKSIQCGRKVDVFKLWLMWKSKGNMGFEKSIDNAFECARHLTDKVRQLESAGFRLVLDKPQCSNVCFWYIPPSLRGQEETPEWWAKVGKVAPLVKERMMKEGTAMVTYNPLGNLVNFFRVVVPNLDISTSDMDFLIDEIVRLGEDIVISN